MNQYKLFLTVVYVVRNQENQLRILIERTTDALAKMVSDYELVIVDNASDDASVRLLKDLTAQTDYPNIQVYALAKETDNDTASWVGLENALGDFVAVIDPTLDDIGFLPEMLNRATEGVDVVFANNTIKPEESLIYRFANSTFNSLFSLFNGTHLAKEAPQYRLLNRIVVNFILQHRQPALTYRHLPATGGFSRVKLDYSSPPLETSRKKLRTGIDRGLRLLVSTTNAPMRLVSFLSIFGASANLLYSVYVVAIAVFKTDVAPGWVSLSLQQSGMFFLISLVLLVLGEYMLHMASLNNEGPLYHIAHEFTSVRIPRSEK